jgi:hypothetical protein
MNQTVFIETTLRITGVSPNKYQESFAWKEADE